MILSGPYFWRARSFDKINLQFNNGYFYSMRFRLLQILVFICIVIEINAMMVSHLVCETVQQISWLWQFLSQHARSLGSFYLKISLGLHEMTTPELQILPVRVSPVSYTWLSKSFAVLPLYESLTNTQGVHGGMRDNVTFHKILVRKLKKR